MKLKLNFLFQTLCFSPVHRTPSEAPQWRTCYVPKWQTFLFLGIWTCCLTVPVTWKLDGCLYWVDHFGNYPLLGGQTCIILTHPTAQWQWFFQVVRLSTAPSWASEKLSFNAWMRVGERHSRQCWQIGASPGCLITPRSHNKWSYSRPNAKFCKI